MNPTSATALFAPLGLEQGLHLLDVLTWFPTSDPTRWHQAAEYLTRNVPSAPPPSPSVCRQVAERILAAAPAALEDESMAGRWRDIPQPKWLYQVKYDLLTLLYPDDWFIFMNMGYADSAQTERADGSPERAIWQFAANLYDRVANQVDLTGARLLEVGCGRGGGLALVANSHRPAQVVGLDSSPRNIAFCRRTHAHPALAFEVADAEHLPHPDASFDAVLNIESAHCYPHVENFLAETHRVLRPGGYLLLADEWWSEQTEQLRGLLRDAGLTIIVEEDLTAGIIRALNQLQERAGELLASLPEGQSKKAYERFFNERVCRESAHSYISGRFVFLQFLVGKID